MPRLLINPGTPQAWEIDLLPGTYTIGRTEDNDYQIAHPSVSSSHCELVVDTNGVLLRDLDSSNGTFVERNKVTESRLQPGQHVQLGAVDMIFDGGSAPAVSMPKSNLKISHHRPELVEEPVAETGTAILSPPLPPPIRENASPLSVGTVFCKTHPKSLARFLCEKCERYFCDLCVTARQTATSHGYYCRKCGTACVPVKAQPVATGAPRGFFARLPGVFVYPFRGIGILLIIIGSIVFAGMGRMPGIFAIPMFILGLGYLFSYMQNIVHATAAEEDTMPDLPGMDGLFAQFISLIGTILISFGPAIFFAYLAIGQEQPWAGIAMVPAVLFGCAYFPMAFLAVAMKDNLMAANPLVVIPSILKVPGEYALTVILLGGIFVFRWLGTWISSMAGHRAYETTSMAELFLMFALQIVWSVISLYLLSVNMRILGILYVTKKDKLNWF